MLCLRWANFLLVQIPAYAASPSVATVHTHDAHCNATNCHYHADVTHVSETRIWEKEDFLSWAKTISSSKAKSLIQEVEHAKEANFQVQVFTMGEFKKLLKELPSDMIERVYQSVLIVKGSQMPTAIPLCNMTEDFAVQNTTEMQVSDTEEYVLLVGPITWCAICKALGKLIAIALFTFLLERWVFEPFAEWIEAWWQRIGKCPEGHQNIDEAKTYITCRYAPNCMGTWMRIIADYGTYAECECECGAVWYEYNPLR